MDSPEFTTIEAYLYQNKFGGLLYDLHNHNLGFSMYEQCEPETTDLCLYTISGILIEEPVNRELLSS